VYIVRNYHPIAVICKGFALALRELSIIVREKAVAFSYFP